MKQQNKEALLALLLLLFFVLFIFVGLEYSSKDNNWWTRALCISEGEYQERLFYDVCIINETEYLAKFILMKDQKKGWKLIK